MNKQAQDLANMINELASKSGMRASELHTAIIDVMYLDCCRDACSDIRSGFDLTDQSYAIADRCRNAGVDTEKLNETIFDARRMTTESDRDFLGDLAAQMSQLDPKMGQFFTPWEVCRLNANFMIDADSVHTAIDERGFVSAMDPAAGSGALLLAVAERIKDLGFDPTRELFVEATDLDLMAFKMCYIQLSLRGIPARVIHGDSITQDQKSVRYTAAFFNTFEGTQSRRRAMQEREAA